MILDAVAATADGAGPTRIIVEDGRIAAVEPLLATPPGALRGVLLPGFVDGHVHGALGVDFADCTADEARRAVAFHAANGTTTLVASIATAPLPVLERQLARLAPLVEDGVLAGLHLEGPYLSAGRRGAHAAHLLRTPDADELRRLVAAAAGAPLAVTIAPELPGAADAVRLLSGLGVRVLVGHTACSAAEALAALDAGATGATHLFNGMPPLAGREPGPVGALLLDPRASLELIGDGRHLADATVDLVRTVAPGRAMLVSDAMAAAGLGDGDHALAGSVVRVRGGVARTPDGSLAGSTAPLLAGVLRLADRGVPLPEVVALSSGTAAAALGIPSGVRAGAPADLVHLVEDEGRWRLAAVFLHGERIGT